MSFTCAITITVQRPEAVVRPECVMAPMGTEKHNGTDATEAGGSV